MPAVFETYGTPTKETLKLIHDLCDLHSHLHLHDAAGRCAARYYWVRQTSNALQCANARHSSITWLLTSLVPRTECDIRRRRARTPPG
jgi:hypothetical protein